MNEYKTALESTLSALKSREAELVSTISMLTGSDCQEDLDSLTELYEELDAVREDIEVTEDSLED